MHTIEVDDETYASLEALAKREQASVGSVLKRALSRLPGMRKPAAPVSMPHGYKIPVSEGRRPFTTEDVLREEDELYREGKA
jgi:negative regulator of replication initiation